MKTKKKESSEKGKKKITIRCRVCLMVDTYTEDEKVCRHCGSPLFKIDQI